jgi:pSer/pThr/pTyr-binding forkhead associated (FHA) protein
VTACLYCGRENDPGARFCMDCGKAMSQSTGLKAGPAPAVGGGESEGGGGEGGEGGEGGRATARVPSVPGTQVVARSAVAREEGEPLSCPFCGGRASALQPFCPQCGRRLTAPGSGPCCPRCASPVGPGIKFCATCGAPLVDVAAARRVPSGPSRAGATMTLVLLDDLGKPVRRFDRNTLDTTIGRQDGDLRFPEDASLSPLHAKVSWEKDTLVVRDLGSRNGTWVFLEAPHRLVDGDLLLIGSQVIRFRRLGYPGPHPPDADATKRMGSVIPSADIASLTQLRSDGSGRDVLQLSPGRDVTIGREQGDWLFPYDPSMSARHALVRSEDADFVVVDANSRNGVALAARGDMPLQHNSRILVGDKLLRIEIPA